MEIERIYAHHESGCSLEIYQWCRGPCFAGAEVSLDVYLSQHPILFGFSGHMKVFQEQNANANANANANYF
jgi:hypothetical protein